jgi:hypothetical protein
MRNPTDDIERLLVPGRKQFTLLESEHARRLLVDWFQKTLKDPQMVRDVA